MPNERSLSNLSRFTGSTPKLTSREVLIYIATRPDDTIASPEVASTFKITPSDAVGRLKKLHSWGCLKLDDPTLKRNRRYVITPWGLKMAAKWEEEMDDE